jgi:Tfp pilus assembly protein PilO
MADNPFLLVTILVLVTILLIFAMRYFAAARRAHLRAASDDAYRELAQKAVSVQTASAAALAGLQADLAEIKTRLAAVEKILREVE